MAEPMDAIVPILQRIQADLADVRRDLGGKIDGLAGKVDELTERMDAFEDYRMRSEIAAIKARLNGPEGQR